MKKTTTTGSNEDQEEGAVSGRLHKFVMFDDLTPKEVEILKHRIKVNGGFWEILCECGANTFNIGGMAHVPSPFGLYKDRESPTGLAHWEGRGGCDKNIIVHKWHNNFPGFTPKPICSHCGQDLPEKT